LLNINKEFKKKKKFCLCTYAVLSSVPVDACSSLHVAVLVLGTPFQRSVIVLSKCC